MKPLAGRTVLVTRSAGQAGRLSEALRAEGARVVEAPVIDLLEPADWAAVDGSLSRLADYDVVIFTSANAVDRYAGRMSRLGREWPAGSRPRVVAIGPTTARALDQRGVTAWAVASEARAEGVMALLSAEPLAGLRVLMPRAEVARELLPERLRAGGAVVDLVTVYRTVPVPVTAEVRDLIERRAIDVVTFTSASTVTNLLAGIGGPEPLRGVEIAAIGPVTGRAAEEAGLPPTIIARGVEMEDLARAIAERYAGSR